MSVAFVPGAGAAVPGASAQEASSAGLAEALVALEARFDAERPERVVVTDDSDPALAAALVAAKLGIRLEATPDATGEPSDNARVIAQLAGTYTAGA